MNAANTEKNGKIFEETMPHFVCDKYKTTLQCNAYLLLSKFLAAKKSSSRLSKMCYTLPHRLQSI